MRERPTLAALIARVVGAVDARTNGAASIARAPERAFALAQAGLAHLLHGHLDWLYRQLFPQHADLEGLLLWGDWLEVPIKRGAYATGTVTLPAEAGATLPAGSALVNGAGRKYVTTAAASQVPAWGTIVASIRALDVGAAGNSAPTTLTLLAAPPGVASSGETGDLTGGTDTEQSERYRARVVRGLRSPYPTGSEGDYVTWALQVEGVTRAWEFPRRMGAGTVSLGFVNDDAGVIPDSTLVAAVQAHLDANMPQDMRAVYVAPPIPNWLVVGVTVTGAVNDADVESALRAFLLREAELERPVSRSQLDEVLSLVPGETSHTITTLIIAPNGEPPGRSVLDETLLTPEAWGILVFGALMVTHE